MLILLGLLYYNYNKYTSWSFYIFVFSTFATICETSVSVLCMEQVSCLYLLYIGVLVFHSSACDQVQVLSSNCNVEGERKSAHVLGWDRSFS